MQLGVAQYVHGKSLFASTLFQVVIVTNQKGKSIPSTIVQLTLKQNAYTAQTKTKKQMSPCFSM